ncbi:MAG TPA: TlpA disulfide reductase family protein [Acidimicrobiales bacterium]|nr:TlpA disulfide reductase family protein [Acidimicrobiales bacterium]
MKSPRGSRRIWWACVVLAGTAIIGGAAALSSSDDDKAAEKSAGPGPGPEQARATGAGKRAAAVELPNIREGGPAVSLAALSGKPVVMNFFASWCIPCAKELPAFQAVAEETKGEVAFIGINHQDNREAGQELLDKTGVRFAAGYDPKGEVARAFGLRGMPTTVFISADGRVLARLNGEMSAQELREAMEEHFGRATRAS